MHFPTSVLFCRLWFHSRLSYPIFFGFRLHSFHSPPQFYRLKVFPSLHSFTVRGFMVICRYYLLSEYRTSLVLDGYVHGGKDHNFFFFSISVRPQNTHLWTQWASVTIDSPTYIHTDIESSRNLGILGQRIDKFRIWRALMRGQAKH